MAIDAKDDTTHDHLQRVKVYATEIGRELHLAPLELQALEQPRCCTTSASWRSRNTSSPSLESSRPKSSRK